MNPLDDYFSLLDIARVLCRMRVRVASTRRKRCLYDKYFPKGSREQPKADKETVKKIEEAFKGITQTLKQRKADIINDIIDKFNIEKKKIDDAEADWMLKQDISEKLVQFDTEQNSAFLLANSKFIMEGIRKLSEKIQFNELNVFNNILTSLIIEGKHDEDGNIVSPKEYSLEEIIYVLSKYISMGEPNVLSYKA